MFPSSGYFLASRLDAFKCKKVSNRPPTVAGAARAQILGEFFRFPLNCSTELRREHQHPHSKPLPKCHFTDA
jgi:hypothetical protein